MRDPNFLYVCETIEKVLKEHPDFDTIKIYYNTYKSNTRYIPTVDTIHKLDVCTEIAASEQGARLQSMDGAVRACREKSEEYQKVYNRLRKTKITSELVILSAGVKCLEAQAE